MTTLSPRSLPYTLIPSLNALLAALALPFTLDHPTDLTPSLLLAIFESLISARLPIPAPVRQSRTREAKSRAMLVLLGVLECDVLRGGTAAADADAEHSVAASNVDDSALGGAGGVSVDGWVDEIGLGEVDPERLADGGWEETIFVGELLCWLARRKGILPRIKSFHKSSHSRSLYSNHHSYGTEEGDTADFSTSLLLQPSPARNSRSHRRISPSVDDPDPDLDTSTLSHITDIPRHPSVHSPEPSLSASVTTSTDLSIRARSVSSRTSVSNVHEDPDEFEEASQDTLQMYDPRRMMQDAEEDDDQPPMFQPRCIHELEDPSYIRALAGSSSSFDTSALHEHISEEDISSGDEEDDADEEDNDDLYAPPTPTPQRVRFTGWIDPVDAATELSQFAASRSSHSHSQLHAFSANTGSSSGLPSQLQPPLHRQMGTDELSKPTARLKSQVSPHPLPGAGRSRISRPLAFASSSPSPSPSPPPSPRSTSSKRLPSRLSVAPPPPPPLPTTHSDSPFDVSFSTLNNTSTPAKPRLQRHARLQVTTETDVYAGMDRSHQGATSAGATGTTDRPHRRDRTSSYTPSPPSFSTPGSLRSGGAGGGPPGKSSSVKLDPAGTTEPKTRLGTSASSTIRMSTKGKSPPPVAPADSTATTNSLLTERARLLTELAALKRARAAIDSGGPGTAVGNGTSVRTGSRGDRLISPRVGVGV